MEYLKKQGCQEGDGVEWNQMPYASQKGHRQIYESQEEKPKVGDGKQSRFSGKARVETKLTIRDNMMASTKIR